MKDLKVESHLISSPNHLMNVLLIWSPVNHLQKTPSFNLLVYLKQFSRMFWIPRCVLYWILLSSTKYWICSHLLHSSIQLEKTFNFLSRWSRYVFIFLNGCQHHVVAILFFCLELALGFFYSVSLKSSYCSFVAAYCLHVNWR